MWQTLLIFYFIFGTSSYLLRRTLAKKFHDKNRLINAAFFIVFLLPTALLLAPLFPHNLAVGWVNIAFLLAGSIIWPLFNILAFKANKTVDVGIYTVINNLSPFFTLLFALTILNESLTTHQYAGILLLIFSGLLVALPQLRKNNETHTYGILLCLLSTAVLGTAVAYERFMLTRIDLGAYFIYGWGSQIFWMAILARKELKNLPLLFKETPTRKLTFGYGLTNVLKSASFILALKLSGSAAVVGAATNFMSVTVIISAYIFLAERKNLIIKLTSAIIGILGLFLVAK